MYNDAAIGYRVAYPPGWAAREHGGGSMTLHDPRGPAFDGVDLSDWERAKGGVDRLSRDLKFDEEMRYANVLPNHCTMLSVQPLAVAAGTGRVYTLQCDNPTRDGTHRAQHALVAANDVFYNVWLRVGSTVGGDPVPELMQMLTSLRLPADE